MDNDIDPTVLALEHATKSISLIDWGGIHLPPIPIPIPPRPHLPIPALHDGDVFVYNESRQDVTVSIPASNRMSENFSSPTLVRPGASASGHVKASILPGQSFFDIAFNGDHSLRVDAGKGSFEGNPCSDDGKVAGLAAPTSIFGLTSAYHFFVGQGLFSPLVNSFITANLPAIAEHIKTSGLSLNIAANTTLSLTSLGVTPSNLFCTYASVNAIDPTTWKLNAILRLRDGDMAGNLTYKNTSGGFQLSIHEAQVLLSATLKSDSFALTVDRLQVSLEDYKIAGNVNAVLNAMINLADVVVHAIAEPHRLAGLINSVLNKTIIDAINSLLTGLAASLGGALGGGGMQVLATRATSETHTIREQGDEYARWMSHPAIQAKPLSAIHLPGTHDSGAYALTDSLSNVRYDDIAFLWALKPDAAPIDGKMPVRLPLSPQTPVHLGGALYHFVIRPIVNSVSQAHDQSILQQLKGGIRWLDLRLYLDDDGQLYLQHGLRGPSFEDVLEQLKQFIEGNSPTAELVYVQISHVNFGQETTGRVAQMITDKFAATNLFHQPNPASATRFNFQTLADSVLSTITAGQTKIFFLNEDSHVDYPAPITNTDGFDGNGMTAKLNYLDWAQAVSVADITSNVLGWLSGEQAGLLRQVATANNGRLAGALKAPSMRRNLIRLDWFQLSAGELPVPTIISMNFA